VRPAPSTQRRIWPEIASDLPMGDRRWQLFPGGRKTLQMLRLRDFEGRGTLEIDPEGTGQWRFGPHAEVDERQRIFTHVYSFALRAAGWPYSKGF